MEEITVLNENYKIIQNNNGFKFSIDAVLLSDFFNAKKNSKVLDIGTGNGIIPVLLVMKDKAEDITGIDIQEESTDLARRNIKLNNLEDKIDIVTGDIKKFSKGNTFDVIISNPPYMSVDGKKINPNDSKAIARHEIALDLKELVKAAKRLLKPVGTFYLVHRSYRVVEICRTLEENNFCVKRLKFVYFSKEHNSNLVLIEATKGKKYKLEIESPLFLNE